MAVMAREGVYLDTITTVIDLEVPTL